MSWVLTVAVAALMVGACQGDGAEASPDAATLQPPDGVCDQSMEVGRCQIVGGGECFGLPDEVTQFVPLTEGETLQVVTGQQGALMFVMAVRTAGIMPGNPEVPSQNDPIVEINVNRTAYSVVGRFRSRVAFAPDSGDMFATSNLFVVLDADPPVEDGQSLTAQGLLRDAAGAERCGSVIFDAAR
jgi:hypothetical protein